MWSIACERSIYISYDAPKCTWNFTYLTQPTQWKRFNVYTFKVNFLIQVPIFIVFSISFYFCSILFFHNNHAINFPSIRKVRERKSWKKRKRNLIKNRKINPLELINYKAMIEFVFQLMKPNILIYVWLISKNPSQKKHVYCWFINL